jgi:uncharacterized protein (DUF1810 family)
MKANVDLKRFLDAQQQDYQAALNEVKAGRKRSHWIWYIFPQISGLGFSSTSVFYAIKDIEEAGAYLQHPVLGQRLLEITKILLELPESNATVVLGSPDDLKLKSCMTLFANVQGSSTIFQQVLDKFFDGEMDSKTLKILGSKSQNP